MERRWQPGQVVRDTGMAGGELLGFSSCCLDSTLGAKETRDPNM